jgi:WD40 repeat protein
LAVAPPPSAAPRRAIYRGLQSLDEEDEDIFFGRDAPIAEGIDALRRMRDGSAKSMLVILGASGAGKSSFLKAGLLARLKRDGGNFLVLPVVRPERAALTGTYGMAASLSCDPADLKALPDFVDLFARLRAPVVERLRRIAENSGEIYATRPPTIVIPIDQAEELFAAENSEAGHVFELLAGAVRTDPDTIIVATIRSDSFEKLQDEPRLAEVQMLPFGLARLPHGAFKEVIEGPARLANPKFAIEAALTERLLEDLQAGDALPLLAFTLERLWLRHRGGGTLTLAEYVDDLGGLQGAIKGAVEAALALAQRDAEISCERVELERLVRAAFIPSLVQLDDADGEPRRRVERLDALPEATLPLVRHLINQRLLVSDWSAIDGIETDTVEVAHEAILRQWPALRGWIAEERESLCALDGVRAAAAEWDKHQTPGQPEQSESWLTHHSSRLEEAEALITRPGFAKALTAGEIEYLSACRAMEDAERLAEKRGIARTRRLQRNIGALIAIAAIVILIAGAGVFQILTAVAARTTDSLTQIAGNEATAGYYDRAARYALASVNAADWPMLGLHGDAAEAELSGDSSGSRALAVLRGHDNRVESAAFSPDGTRIVTASDDKTARIWDAKTAREIIVLRGHHAVVESAAFSPDGTRVVTASWDKTARIWDAKNARLIAVLRGHEGIVGSAAFSPDGRRIVTASADRTARIWDAKTGHEIAVLRGHGGRVLRANYSPDGTRIVTASQDKTARIWDPNTSRLIAVLRGHDDTVEWAAFSPDGTRIVTASLDKTARTWDAKTAVPIAVLRGHDRIVFSASFSPDGTRVVTASGDKTSRIWDANTARLIAVLWGHEGPVFSAAFSPDGTRIVSASMDKTARMWSAKKAGESAVLRGHDSVITSIAFSPDGKRIVTASNDKTARIWNANTADEIAVLRGHDDYINSAAFSPDGTRIVTASTDRTARIWDVTSAHQIAVLRGHEGVVWSAAFSVDGTRIVTASADATARIWDAKSTQEIAVLHGHDGTVWSAAFSPDGTRIVTASADRTVRIWEAKSARQIAILRGHEGVVWSAAFSRDGTRIVTASADTTARIWDAKNTKLIAVLRGHDEAVNSAAFSPDGTRIVTVSSDKTARIWDAKTARLIAVLRGLDEALSSAAFSPDGTRIVTASSDAQIWNVARMVSEPRAELIRRICETTLANGLSRFSAQDLRAAPMLDPQLDTDACHPPSFWARLDRIFSAALSQ